MFPIRDHNPSARTPYVTYAIIALNVLVFMLEPSINGDQMVLAGFWRDWAMIPAAVTQGGELRGIFTSMFLHAGILHLGGNMLFLWVFGDNLEDQMGPVGFAAFYLACGVAAALTHIAADPGSPIPTVGASGAIAGVMGGYLLLFPKAKVDVLVIFVFFFWVFTISAWVVLGVWFAIQLFSGLGAPASNGGVAYWAHAGGFFAGVLLTLPVWLKRGARGFWLRNDGHPPHPGARYSRSNVPLIRRKR
ncbi:MAG: rhomboid family intramembrane serine protease [Rhodobacteraceae bacterium]|nr:rhomboid family intramembrane serine protease [Paracoccaceae bacterium]MCP5341663.1 rhomboid family intramembrane serine protease [Paracoccaceae bacterium]